MADEQSWAQWAIGSLGTLWAGTAIHQYALGRSRAIILHKRVDKVEADFVRKDTLVEAIERFTQIQKEGREDHQRMSRRLEEVARDVHIMMGEIRARFSEKET